jgi:hypothetical protein
MNVDLYDHPQHEGHDHRGLNRMSSEADYEQQAVAEFTNVIKKTLGQGKSYLETNDLIVSKCERIVNAGPQASRIIPFVPVMSRDRFHNSGPK